MGVACPRWVLSQQKSDPLPPVEGPQPLGPLRSELFIRNTHLQQSTLASLSFATQFQPFSNTFRPFFIPYPHPTAPELRKLHLWFGIFPTFHCLPVLIASSRKHVFGTTSGLIISSPLVVVTFDGTVSQFNLKPTVRMQLNGTFILRIQSLNLPFTRSFCDTSGVVFILVFTLQAAAPFVSLPLSYRTGCGVCWVDVGKQGPASVLVRVRGFGRFFLVGCS